MRHYLFQNEYFRSLHKNEDYSPPEPKPKKSVLLTQRRKMYDHRRYLHKKRIKLNPIRNGTKEFDDLSVIMIDGKPRVKATLTLEKLIQNMKNKGVYSP